MKRRLLLPLIGLLLAPQSALALQDPPSGPSGKQRRKNADKQTID